MLLTFDDYQRLIGGNQDSIIDLLGLPPGVEDAELEPPRARDLARPADLPMGSEIVDLWQAPEEAS